MAAPVESKSDDCISSVSLTDLKEWADSLSDKDRLAMNVATRHRITEVMLTRESLLKNNHEYSVKIPLEGKPVTSQRSTGRCWLFAALNVMRIPFMKEKNLDSFEFSQSYLFFWDKFSRCEYFLEQIIDTVKEPLEGRLVQHLLSKPTEDGGQYDMIVNIVEKYGVVPKDVYPEVNATERSLWVNRIINAKLRDYALAIRTAANAKESPADSAALRAMKTGYLKEIYRVMAINFGVPPLNGFSFQFVDKDKKPRKIVAESPLAFYNDHVRTFVNVSKMYSLVHDPRNEFYRLLTVDRLGNMTDGKRPSILYVNVPIQDMKEVAISMLKDGEPVWFGCHVSQRFHGDTGAMDLNQFDYKNVLGIQFAMDKADRLRYGESLMSHAMVFTGVDLDESGNPIKWRVENSWGKDRGKDGYCLMTDDWFTEFNYQIAVDESRLTPKMKAVLAQEPKVLPLWDPMGALAK